MVCPPWLKKWGGGTCPPPSPTKLRPWAEWSFGRSVVLLCRIFYSELQLLSLGKKTFENASLSLNYFSWCTCQRLKVICGCFVSRLFKQLKSFHQMNLVYAKYLLLAEFQETFDLFDENGDGWITEAELRTCTQSFGLNYTEPELRGFIKEHDSDGEWLWGRGGGVDYTEPELRGFIKEHWLSLSVSGWVCMWMGLGVGRPPQPTLLHSQTLTMRG